MRQSSSLSSWREQLRISWIKVTIPEEKNDENPAVVTRLPDSFNDGS